MIFKTVEGTTIMYPGTGTGATCCHVSPDICIASSRGPCTIPDCLVLLFAPLPLQDIQSDRIRLGIEAARNVSAQPYLVEVSVSAKFKVLTAIDQGL